MRMLLIADYSNRIDNNDQQQFPLLWIFFWARETNGCLFSRALEESENKRKRINKNNKDNVMHDEFICFGTVLADHIEWQNSLFFHYFLFLYYHRPFYYLATFLPLFFKFCCCLENFEIYYKYYIDIEYKKQKTKSHQLSFNLLRGAHKMSEI